MNNTTGSSGARECTFNQFVGTLSRIFYGSYYDGCRWKRQGEQGYFWWDKKTQSYIDTSELYMRIIDEMRLCKNPDWAGM